jgi:hypothetical protein
MRKSKREEMQISEHELLAMTSTMDDMHHDLMPGMHEAAAEWIETNHEDNYRPFGVRAHSRRIFLLGTGGVMGGLVLAACGGGSKSATSGSSTSGSSGTTGGLTGDLAVAALAAGLENLAVNTYQGAIDNAAKLGVPPAVATFAMTAQSHHKQHAAAWNSILTGAGKPAVTGVDQTVKTGVIDPGFAAVKTVPDLAKLALGLENVAAATYLNGIQNALQDTGAIKVAASIQPVEMQHAAILNFVLGEYPVPDSFSKTDGARTPSDTIG